jgi:hypothetical protein
MKISFEAFSRDQTVLELFFRAILKSRSELNIQNGLSRQQDPYDELLKDILKGKADLKLVVWFKNKEVLENELNYPKKTYVDMYTEFTEKEIRKICMSNSAIDIFKDFDRGNDFFESVQKTMEFYIKYRLFRTRNLLIVARIVLFLSLGLIKGI